MLCGTKDSTDIKNDRYQMVFAILRIINQLPTEEFGELLDIVSLSTAADQFWASIKELGESNEEMNEVIEKLKIADSEIAIMTNASNPVSVLALSVLISKKQTLEHGQISAFLKTPRRGINGNIGPKYESGGLINTAGELVWNFLKIAYGLLKPLSSDRGDSSLRVAWWKEWKTNNKMWMTYYDALTIPPDMTKLREFWKHVSLGQYVILFAIFTILPTLVAVVSLPFMDPDMRREELSRLHIQIISAIAFIAVTLGPTVGFIQGCEIVRQLAAPETPGMVLSRWLTGRREIALLFKTTIKTIEDSLQMAFLRTVGPVPLKFMDRLSVTLFLPAITTNYRADSIRWREIIQFIVEEFGKCNAIAFDFKARVEWFRPATESSLQKFYKDSDLVGQLLIKFWRLPRINQYNPAKKYVSTNRHPEPVILE
jgi:hypothetical protein